MRLWPNIPQRPTRFTPRRSWQPLSDDEWCTLAPFVFRATAGRPIENPRRRLDAIFWLAEQKPRTRWADLPAHFGKPDTVSRQFRRWAKAGLWTRLLQALADRDYPGAPILRRMASWICRAYRRAHRILGLAGLVLARRLGFNSALRGPHWLLADPDLSERLMADIDRRVARAMREGVWANFPPGWIRACNWLLRSVAGSRGVPGALDWP